MQYALQPTAIEVRPGGKTESWEKMVTDLFGVRWLMAAVLLWCGSLEDAIAAGPFEFEFKEVSPDVWAGVRPDGPRYPVMGSAMFVIGDDGVVVFDGGGVAKMSEQVIAKIRSLTDKPVTYVVISHWHGDHHFGVYRFQQEFPNVQFVTHTFTDAAMDSAKIDYILNYPTSMRERASAYQKQLDEGVDEDGEPLSPGTRIFYERAIRDAAELDRETKRIALTRADIVFDDHLVLVSGKRRIELMKLGNGNTEGDIVMWLPHERIVATGDLVVLPTPYAFNVPPRAWAATLKKLNALDYRLLIPGHGEIQENTDYVDLLIEASESIADQRDAMAARGLSHEDIEKKLDFSTFESRFTKGGDPYIKAAYDAWFEGPFRKAATKELTGEPMVTLEPRANAQ